MQSGAVQLVGQRHLERVSIRKQLFLNGLNASGPVRSAGENSQGSANYCVNGVLQWWNTEGCWKLVLPPGPWLFLAEGDHRPDVYVG